MHALSPRVPCLVSISLVFFPYPNPLRHVYIFCVLESFGPLVVVTVTFMPFGGFSISQISISHTVASVASGREAIEKKGAEARRCQGQC